MGKRTWFVSLQGVKISVFILTVLGVSLFSSLGYSRTASAEGFLQRTVQCVLSILVPYDCRPVTSTPATPAPAPAPSPAAPTESPSSNPTGPTSSAERAVTSPSTSTVPSEATGYTTPSDLLQPEVLKEVEKVPELPAAVHNRSFNYEPMSYLAYMYGVKGATTTAASAEGEVIESTANGWHILGVAWYWWLIGLAVMTSVVIWLKKAKYKRDLSIVNRP